MLGYKHILVALDLSPISKEVCKHATLLAQTNHAQLSIAHVMEHSPAAYGGEFSIPIDVNLEQLLEDQARKQMLDIAKHFDIPLEHQYLESGSVKNSITDLAMVLNVDLIVVGTHGHHGLDVLLGSRANAILHKAHCDVLVVRVK